LHSFPTRRSSDLRKKAAPGMVHLRTRRDMSMQRFEARMANQYETSTMTRARRPVTSSNCRGTIVHTHFCAFLLGTALVASCSAAIPDVGDCESDEQCVDLFGDGFVCGSNGFCQSVPQDCGSNAECQEELGFGGICTEGQCTRVQPIPRCTKTYPEDLWTRPESYRQAVVFGSVMD